MDRELKTTKDYVSPAELAFFPGAQAIQFPSPFYGQGTIFQYPSSIRLGIKFQF